MKDFISMCMCSNRLQLSTTVFVKFKHFFPVMVQIFVVGSERRTCFETECIMALQGHPRSLILAPVESAYASCYWSSIVTLRILGVISLDSVANFVAPRSEDPKLIIRVITFEL